MTYLKPKDGFLGLEGDLAKGPESADAVIVPFGVEQSVSFGGGTARGPMAMIEASHQVELFDDELWCEPIRRFSVATRAPFKIATPLAKAMDQIEAEVAAILDDGKFPMVFGGEHSLSAGIVRALVKRYPDLAILHFDAHADLRDGYDGEPYSHAAALRRCLDHETVRLVSIGIRNISAEEIPFLEANRHRIAIHWGRDRKSYDPVAIAEQLNGRPTYVTVDVDGFDSSLMPATGTPEPGGLFWDDVMPILRAAAERAPIVAADINELAPIDGFNGPDFLAAKLAYKILSYKYLLGDTART